MRSIKTLGKESVAALNDALSSGWFTGAVNQNTTRIQLVDYLKTKLNYTLFCDAGQSAAPCNIWGGANSTYPRFVLPSGAYLMIYDVSVGVVGVSHFFIDANGETGPNNGNPTSVAEAESVDTIALWFNGGATNATLTTPIDRYINLRPGQLAADLGSFRPYTYEYWFR
jgi:hypothetical protein